MLVAVLCNLVIPSHIYTNIIHTQETYIHTYIQIYINKLETYKLLRHFCNSFYNMTFFLGIYVIMIIKISVLNQRNICDI